MIRALTLLTIFITFPASAGKVNTMVLKDQEIGLIRTAIDISTAIYFDSRPNNAIVGAQDAYKVEFIKNFVTVKPVIPNVRTNLLVFTDKDVFHFNLVTGPKSKANEIVKVTRKDTETRVGNQSRIIKRNYRKTSKKGADQLALDWVGWPRSNNYYLFGFQVNTKDKVDSDSFSVHQSKSELKIHSIQIWKSEDSTYRGVVALHKDTLKKKIKPKFTVKIRKKNSESELDLYLPRFGPLS